MSDAPNWIFRAQAPISCSPVIADGVVYVGSEKGVLHAVDKVTGKEKWRFDAQGAHIESPAVNGKHVFLVAGSKLFVLEAEKGTPRPLDQRLAEEVFFPAPRIEGQTVFIGGDEIFVALDTESAEPRWINRDWPQTFVSTPVLCKGVLYAVSYNALIVSIDAQTGRRLSDGGGGDLFNQYDPAVYGGRLYHFFIENFPVGEKYEASARVLISHDISTGEAHLHLGLPQDVRTSPAIQKGLMYFGCQHGSLYAIELNEDTVNWQILTRGPIHSSPSIAEDLVYFGSDDGHLYVVHTYTGELLKAVPTESFQPIRTAPAICDGVVYFGDSAGNLYSWGSPQDTSTGNSVRQS